MNRRRCNRRVTFKPKPGGGRLRLYRDGQPIARGFLARAGSHAWPTWTVLYNLVELGHFRERDGSYVFDGYDYAAAP